MKRVCTEEEKKLIYKNRKQLLMGIFETASASKYSHIFVGLFVSIIVMFAGIFVIATKDIDSRIPFYLWMFFSFTVPNVIVLIIMNRIREKKAAKRFLKQKNLMINGATIVEVNDVLERFAYIEDGFIDENSESIIIDYPSCSYDMTQKNVGERILVMYDENSNFQLVTLNEELSGLIPRYTDNYPLKKDLQQYMRIPHPNMIMADKTGHELSESEKKEFADLHVKLVQGGALKMLKIFGVVIAVGILLVCVLLNMTEEGYPLSKTLPVGAIGFVCLCVFYWFISLIGKVNIRRQAKFVFVKKVVFHSYVIENNTPLVNVYEWNNGRVEKREYPAGNLSHETPYGRVIYKFTDKKGKYILQNTKPLKK